MNCEGRASVHCRLMGETDGWRRVAVDCTVGAVRGWAVPKRQRRVLYQPRPSAWVCSNPIRKRAVGPIYSEEGGRDRPGFQPSDSWEIRFPGALPQAGILRAVGPSISKWFRKGDYARMSVPGRAVGGFRREGLIVILRMLWHSASLLREGFSVDLR